MSNVDAIALQSLVERLFANAGASPEVAGTVARLLVEGDLLGHHTHGVKLAQGYLRDIRTGHAKVEPSQLETIKRSPAAALFDGNHLLGPYCVSQALAFTSTAARNLGIGVANIRRSHHIACLAAYLQPITEQGLVPIILTSDPAVASVAPYGGLDPVYTPNPLAIGIPTAGDPILIDVSMSTVTNGLVSKTRQAGEQLPHPVLQANDGSLSRDPEVFFSEALTSGLGGFGRKDGIDQWGAAVCVLTLDPEFFGGLEALRAEMGHFVDRCLSSRPRVAGEPVRMPGHAGLARRRRYLESGIPLPDDVCQAVRQATQDSGLDCPF